MKQALRPLLDRFIAPWRNGTGLWRRAWWIPLLALVPELIQHAIEWRLGMFASAAAFKAHQADTLRLAFGIPKQLLVFIAMVAAARHCYPAAGLIRWLRLLLAVALMVVFALIPWPLQGHVADGLIEVLGWMLLVPFLLAFVMLVGAVLGDAGMSLRSAFCDGWRKVVLLIAVPALPTLLGQLVHRHNHALAMGQPGWAVGVLMTLDAAWVGALTCWTGAGLSAGYGPPLAKR